MIREVVVLLLVALGQISASEPQCEQRYLKMYSGYHSMCQNPNPTCQIFRKGLTQEDKDFIVRIHNLFRSRVAIGNETLGGVMPPAADMLEMVWDEELAELSQKHAETCFYGHDCTECRALEHFMVGQNIGSRSFTFLFPEDKIKRWDWFLSELYKEVSNFDKRNVEQYVDGGTDPNTEYGHFTQIIWSQSWRVGCGWIYYKEGISNTSYYICNYGPAGNVLNASIYKVGPTCSSCPDNTCCGETCAGYQITPQYVGLCKVINETLPPKGIGQRDVDTLFICDFNGQADCDFIAKGITDWKLVQTVNGNWMTTILKDGQMAAMMSETAFRNLNGTFCFVLQLRSSSVDMRHPHGFSGEIIFIGNDGTSLKFKISSAYERQKFTSYTVTATMPSNIDITILLMLSVGPKVQPQFFDLREIAVRQGYCPS